MKKQVLLTGVFCLLIYAVQCQTKSLIEITSPKDTSTVNYRTDVKGKIFASNTDIWVVVHPMEVTEYWVQPKASVKKDSTWKTSIYFGRPGNLDIGKSFEFRAFSGTDSVMVDGKVLTDWPIAKYSSNLIEVKRK